MRCKVDSTRIVTTERFYMETILDRGGESPWIQRLLGQKIGRCHTNRIRRAMSQTTMNLRDKFYMETILDREERVAKCHTGSQIFSGFE